MPHCINKTLLICYYKLIFTNSFPAKSNFSVLLARQGSDPYGIVQTNLRDKSSVLQLPSSFKYAYVNLYPETDCVLDAPGM